MLTTSNASTGGERKPPAPISPLLLVLLALLSAFTPLSIDMYLPALPTIVSELHSTAGDVQLTLSAFMLAFGFGQIFYGPAGDRFGRRPVILSGILIYIATTIGCAFAAAAGQLTVLRFLQGLAACGSVVLARTMVRDLAEREQAARAMSLIMACSSKSSRRRSVWRSSLSRSSSRLASSSDNSARARRSPAVRSRSS